VVNRLVALGGLQKRVALRGVQPKVIQSVTRHSTITLTLDTYGHLIQGAEAAAVASTADMTSVGEVLAATGTDGASDTCFLFDAKSAALARVDHARVCDETGAAGSEPERKIVRLPYREPQHPADVCESLLQSAGSSGAVAQWLELGTHNP